MVPNKKNGALLKISEYSISLIYLLIVLWELILFARLFVIVAEFNIDLPVIKGFMFVTSITTFPFYLLSNVIETVLLREVVATVISMLISILMSVGITLILKSIIKRNQK